MAALTGEQIAQLAYQAGFRGEDLVRVVAIAKRESSYNPRAFNGNTNTGDKSYGLMQINMLGSMGPARMKAFGITSEDQLYDPLTNMKAAYALYKSSGNQLTPWGGYKGVSDTHGADVEAARTVVNSAGAKGVLGKDFTAMSGGGITEGSKALNDMSDDEIKAYIAANYGYAAGYLNIPQVGDILIDAARKGQTAAQVQARIASTDWWKNTTDSVRTFEGIAASDPATAQRMIAQKQAAISDQAAAMGANIDQATLKTIAWEAISFGWSDVQLNDALVSELKKDPSAITAPRGQMAANIASVKQMAAQYGLAVGDPQAQQYSLSMLDGKLTQQALQAMFINQAKGKYPTLAPQIDAGITPQQFFAQYQSEGAKLLDVPDAAIDIFNDPRFSDVLQVPGDKGPRPMTISEFQQKVRGLPEWKTTQNAQATAADVVDFLGKKMGAFK